MQAKVQLRHRRRRQHRKASGARGVAMQADVELRNHRHRQHRAKLILMGHTTRISGSSRAPLNMQAAPDNAPKALLLSSNP